MEDYIDNEIETEENYRTQDAQYMMMRVARVSIMLGLMLAGAIVVRACVAFGAGV